MARAWRPAGLFVVLSLLSGALTIAATPPLRGADENAHFLRAYGIAQGDILTRQSDARGRTGLWLPPSVASDFSYFDAARERAFDAARNREGSADFSYRAVFKAFSGQAGSVASEPVFKLYGGSEGYSPVSYLPYAAVAGLAKLADLGFLPMLYLMRAAGLLAATALIAYAIVVTPFLRWLFFAVAMLPSGIFARSVVSADGAVLATTLLVVALCLDAAVNGRGGRASRVAWIAVCALTKPPQVVFTLLEAMVRRIGWRSLLAAAAVVAPAVVLALAWPIVAGTEMAAWRMYEADKVPPEQFQIGWKLRYMLAHPLQFPAAMFAGFGDVGELWPQLVGVLGWLDMRLLPAGYWVLTVLLIAACIDRLDVSREARARIALVAAATTFAYVVLVFALLFITVTPVPAERVIGTQGRYFIGIVPLLALIAAAFNPFRLPERLQMAAALALALIATMATLEAILRVDWS